MDKLFSKTFSYEQYKELLQKPLEADLKFKNNINYAHYQKCIVIHNQHGPIVSDKCVSIIDKIESLYFVYTDFGCQQWDDKYYFFIGKLINNIYFSYEVGCSGTGFGLGEESIIHLSQSKELLYNYGLTNKNRELIDKNIKID